MCDLTGTVLFLTLLAVAAYVCPPATRHVMFLARRFRAGERKSPFGA